jgi:hypothetical protein
MDAMSWEALCRIARAKLDRLLDQIEDEGLSRYQFTEALAWVLDTHGQPPLEAAVQEIIPLERPR